MKRAKIGDIIEIQTPAGLVYAQYTHNHPEFLQMLRVYAQHHKERPKDIPGILKGELQLTCFYPLQAALKHELVEVVGQCPVPPETAEFPIFRGGTVDPAIGRVRTWWFWDGEKSWRVGEITEEQRRFPIRSGWNHAYLIDRIVEGWRAETDPE